MPRVSGYKFQEVIDEQDSEDLWSHPILWIIGIRAAFRKAIGPYISLIWHS